MATYGDEYYRKYNHEITKKHRLYERYAKDWDLYEMSYKGGKEFIDYSLHKHARESWTNHEERQNEGICFNYAAAIVDLFNFYLTEKSSTRQFETISVRGLTGGDPDIKKQMRRNIKGFDKDQQWNMFLQDADLHGTNFDVFLNYAQRRASIVGSVGILIDKPSGPYRNKTDEINAGVYPYVTAFSLLDIFDWKYVRNKNTARQELVYLKLKEGDDKYLLWFLDRWERWEDVNGNMKLMESGKNTLGEIPFVWLPNVSGLDYWYIGESDIKEISRITASIIRNISCGEEMLKFCGFPMLVLPKEVDSYDDDGSSNQDVGPTAVLDKDPEMGAGGSPEWLEPQIQQAIEAVLDWTDRKADEIYRIAHLSGVHGQRKSNNEVASGLALRYEFQQLNSVLLQKSQNLSEAELQIIKYWLKWQNRTDILNSVTVQRPKSFSVDELATSLENIFNAIVEIPSDHFAKVAYKHAVTQVLPDMADTDTEAVNKEIDKNAKAGGTDNSAEEEGVAAASQSDEKKKSGNKAKTKKSGSKK